MADLKISAAYEQVYGLATLPFKLLHGVVYFVELAVTAAFNGNLQSKSILLRTPAVSALY